MQSHLRYFEREPTRYSHRPEEPISFCRIAIDPYDITETIGDIGTPGTTTTQHFGTIEACADAALKLIYQRVSSGYRELPPNAATTVRPQPVRTIEVNRLAVFYVHPDGLHVSTFSNNPRNHRLDTWEIATGQLVPQLCRYWEEELLTAHITHDGMLLVMPLSYNAQGNYQSPGYVDVWDVLDGSYQGQSPWANEYLSQIGSNRSNNWLYAVVPDPSGNAQLRIFENLTTPCDLSFDANHQDVTKVTLSGNGQWLAATGKKPESWLGIWELSTHSPISATLRHRCDLPVIPEMGLFNGIALNYDGSVLASATNDGDLYLWNGTEGTLQHRLYAEHIGYKERLLCFSHNDSIIWAPNSNTIGVLQGWNVITGKPLLPLVASTGGHSNFAISDNYALTKPYFGDSVSVWALPQDHNDDGVIDSVTGLVEEITRFESIVSKLDVKQFIYKYSNIYFQRVDAEYSCIRDFMLWARARRYEFSLAAMQNSLKWRKISRAIRYKMANDELEYRKNYEHAPF